MINITIDGPAGAGKSTVAKMIASKYSIVYLDTGAMYRGAAYYVLNKGIEVDDVASVLGVLSSLVMNIEYVAGAQRVIVCGRDITPFIREHNISMAASTVSKIPEVRIKLVDLQRAIASKSHCVLDGRDIGTFVLPNASFKFFLTASLEERARRRFVELTDKKIVTDFDNVLKDMSARDYQDSNRSFAPLVAAKDAIIIDSTALSPGEVVTIIAGVVDAAFNT
ncbi:MAG: (d)CMP kinase [Christensenellaceae bacterium]|jgi:cytidylate kinase|nr:(d)CMP kinase [Christensenellaceae bacterium]